MSLINNVYNCTCIERITSDQLSDHGVSGSSYWSPIVAAQFSSLIYFFSMDEDEREEVDKKSKEQKQLDSVTTFNEEKELDVTKASQV